MSDGNILISIETLSKNHSVDRYTQKTGPISSFLSFLSVFLNIQLNEKKGKRERGERDIRLFSSFTASPLRTSYSVKASPLRTSYSVKVFYFLGITLILSRLKCEQAMHILRHFFRALKIPKFEELRRKVLKNHSYSKNIIYFKFTVFE